MRDRRARYRWLCASVVAVLLCTPMPAAAVFSTDSSPQVPVPRLIKNLEAKLAANPKDVQARFQLARVHYLAFALRQFYLQQTYYTLMPPPYDYDDERQPRQISPLPYVLPRHRARLSAPWRTRLTVEEELWHAARSAWLFHQVLSQQPSHALAHLGLGSLLEQFDRRAARFGGLTIPRVLQHRDPRTLRAHYEQAFRSAWREDSRQASGDFNPFVTEQAAEAYTRSAARAQQLTPHEVETLREMAAATAHLGKVPHPVTPLIFSVQRQLQLGQLLASDRTVMFDLRGLGERERWPWVSGEAAILVWDPEHSGEVTSARQMFGSYTWRLIWRDGFDALAALDDNRDGWLTRGELDGLSVWFDRDGDGTSDRGEVVPVVNVGVQALAVRQEGQDGRHPVHRRGVTFSDGRALPLWDWIADPLPNRQRSSSSHPR